ncbi:ammonia-dependent NAD(+) synthetase [Lactiplantibacillus mudanjiangensis]|uniref:NH(3)-dependent NAD(+) synthetase n=1 Tax=Lactiplantibacillus mudanjiangensis TaxID=1296538 RepID=A0A660DZI8_9LACO|nr:ammonia-dependent NAD(+) synthetase [Lactiplantibacillus mudanjiangensis]VDG18069.1 NAD(+) synthase [Lactobacillus sp.] [Lactiplantibacillus mudanjiangensis]VDG24761.1 NAD(+) synthase [Lactobacillus sp.] [Lactiplantibacillus mudanjiangensis]VDG28490.1 NAD(+) synthase [Lactobacillus sp.] [Lactiplantibacillus mudanjiangensis]VDG31356.1 NAD(+) synthase [Lactobacillus sp.] [Lactiplantibacillus mudanjiangensis]
MRPLQTEIINALHVAPTIDPKTEIRRSIDFLKAYLKKNTFLKTYVLGISGGQDSTLAGKLTQMAISEMRAETGDDDYQFIAVRLPYGDQADEADAMDAIKFMDADVVNRVDIKGATDAMVAALEANDLTIRDFNKGNIKARQRMIVQYGIAGERQGAVVGTDHAAEAVTGFYTKYGDGGADIVPLYRLDKRQGRAMLAELQAPEHLYQKVPTADLEEDRPALPDEVALGVHYDDIDDYLEGKSVDDAAAEKIEAWYLKTAHKRHAAISVFDDFWK